MSLPNTRLAPRAASGRAQVRKPPAEILLLRGSLGILLQPERLGATCSNVVPLRRGLWESTRESPTLKGAPCPERLLRAGAAWERGSLGEHVSTSAHPHPQGIGTPSLGPSMLARAF